MRAASDTSEAVAVDRPARTRDDILYAVWIVVAVASAATVLIAPGIEAVPFHAAVLTFALLVPLCDWPLPRSLGSLAAFLIVTGALFARDWRGGALHWSELSEIPIMALLAGGIAIQVRRARRAANSAAEIAEEQRQDAIRRVRLTQITSHEMRTPLTVATGYLDLVLAGEPAPPMRADLVVVRDELTTLTRAVDRLVRALNVTDMVSQRRAPAAPLVESVVRRWSTIEDRRWVADVDDVVATFAAERAKVALDTMVENALRYTADGDVIRVFARRLPDGQWWYGVADSGRGLPEHVLAGADSHAGRPEDHARLDPLAGTGLGLEIVRTIAHDRGGIVVAQPAPEGGALIAIRSSVEFLGRSDARPTEVSR